MPDQPRFLEIALPCLVRGWWVFPLQPRSKLPFKGSRGFKDASADRAQVEAWGRATPGANCGISTGPSGLVVLDLDGPEGQALLRNLARGDSGVPRTLTVKTGRPGGFHLYYAGTGVPSSQVKDEHLDVRGSTGYVLAPGCIHENGTIYTIVVDSPVAAVPAWVGPWVRSRGKGVVPAERNSSPTHANRPLPSIPAGGAATLAARALGALQGAGAEPWSPETETRLRLALSAIPANIDGQTWVSFGMALCDLHWGANGHDVGFELWDEWSRTSQGKGAGNGEYRGRADLAKRWRGFQEKTYQGVRATVGSIFAKARELGGATGDNTGPHVSGVKTQQINGVPALPAPIFSSAPNIVFPDVSKGRPLATCRNARLAIRGLGIECRHDAFRDRCTLGGQVVDNWAGELTDNAVHILRVTIENTYRFDPGTTASQDAAVQECLVNSRDPLLDYLDGLEWDGVSRLQPWLINYLGAHDTKFNRVVGALALMAAVRRAREPGCKFDQITVFEGPEGTLKSGAIKVMAGEWFSDQTLLGLSDREQQEAVSGIWLYEIADLAGHNKAEVERTKAFASRTHDRARPAYGRRRIDQPRRCVFFGTTNSETYLKSQTGNRRFWPVRCGRIDLEGLKRDRDQLWAEASALEERGSSLVLPESLWGDAALLQDQRRDSDPWEDALEGLEKKDVVKTEGGQQRISSRDLLDLVLRLPIERQHHETAKRVAHAMRRLGWMGPVPFRRDGAVMKGYVKDAGKEQLGS